MKSLFSKYFFAFAVAGLSISLMFSGCKDDSTTKPAPALSIDIGHLAGNKQFYLDSTYTIESGDQITPLTFKYYISNLQLINTNNEVIEIPDTYFLVNMDDDSSKTLEMEGVPEGSFKAIRFLIGVDSTRNVSGAQDGALDVGNGMFWTWNTGYIFLKIEGTSPTIAAPGVFTYHIGGFSGATNNIKQVDLTFDGEILELTKGAHPEIHLIVNVLEIFKNPTTIDLSVFPASVVMPTPEAAILSDNYKDMIRFDHIHAD